MCKGPDQGRIRGALGASAPGSLKGRKKKKGKGKKKRERKRKKERKRSFKHKQGYPEGLKGRKLQGRQIKGGGMGMRAPFFNFAPGRQNK